MKSLSIPEAFRWGLYASDRGATYPQSVCQGAAFLWMKMPSFRLYHCRGNRQSCRAVWGSQTPYSDWILSSGQLHHRKGKGKTAEPARRGSRRSLQRPELWRGWNVRAYSFIIYSSDSGCCWWFVSWRWFEGISSRIVLKSYQRERLIPLLVPHYDFPTIFPGKFFRYLPRFKIVQKIVVI